MHSTGERITVSFGVILTGCGAVLVTTAGARAIQWYMDPSDPIRWCPNVEIAIYLFIAGALFTAGGAFLKNHIHKIHTPGESMCRHSLELMFLVLELVLFFASASTSAVGASLTYDSDPKNMTAITFAHQCNLQNTSTWLFTLSAVNAAIWFGIVVAVVICTSKFFQNE
jgi:hypothetical protein